MKDLQFDTKAIREGYQTTNEQEHSEAIFLTSSFKFDSAEQAAARFAKKEPGNIYARFTNPTVDAFERKLAALEGAQACVATASGMAAIFATIMALVKSGEHIVASRNMFGTSIVLLNTIVSKFDIAISYVDLSDVSQWENAVQDNTKLFLLETPSNPLGQVVDITALSKISRVTDILLAVDNALLSPALQTPIKLGVDIVIHSATKYIDGQGRCLAGAVLGSEEIIEKVAGFTRATGPSLSAFNAWIVLKGLDTLSLRMKAHCENALKVATWLENQPQVTKVHYLGLDSHPHHQLAKTQQSGFGGIVSFEVKGGKVAAFKLINATKIFSITANLGDTKSTITHPATTTHGRLSDEEKTNANITDGLIRLSIGLEDTDDLTADIKI
ncbi:O-acetylhomoserine sulfhydrylase (EC 2.5.1.49) / O-succinylhomoserine sulfhydrylase (EC 2.5.1.48) [uncultured Gammaproteobacteria bacterium]|jgi:O-succinylhomoserine sulfhydrylase|uniref:O-succinylhomoserine sulfhydrylase n=3 Tax=sulfur-oxidizing symbionts TaxID=32036 RepID=A0A1H6LXJ3_9GAMM|nr:MULTISPECIES: O-succinylhomoserine sulfhydrylase [Gammaproteobacteria]CAC9430511.1 O-acetylhomoserine sulfhydrylase (EC 2.5.1.49) / O-succinylhomoserine sulfhydrylase (EC 2.5.1.48) [uncultured Gammaproteobacteria bacterium]CAB5503374.1 O-acetylhomoserine sulfhydrylase (EC @ O-succinylhomoserine sulfhydrylase (EC [Bathymodiolus azoricus thioautotrophic gill symbiont]CAB5508013.1 O-acetylhomoserine sulfhydrylase (EC @ O-succinylhomoserine sulfhydrylase (EC [Bathymodiolus thermophilus thioautotr